LPFGSLTVAVAVVVLVPLATTEPGDTATLTLVAGAFVFNKTVTVAD
jgi:hypothetical protein